MKLTVISLIIFLIPSALALSITEVELNPEGKDNGNEWVELYSEEEFNLQGFYLENNDGDTHDLSGEISSYISIDFNKQWLDNNDEKIILKKNNETIDETPIFKDAKNDDFTWSKCDESWIQKQSTKSQSNKCEEAIPPKTPNNNEPQKQKEEAPQQQETKVSETIPEQNDRPPPNPQFQELSNEKEKIVLNLNPPNIEQPTPQTFITKQEKIRLGIFYGFTFFTVVIIILLALRKL